MSKFFIRRPIVAMVIAILTVIVGAVTIATLPVAQFPNIVPPEIRLQATYVGADAQTLEQAVATPIEQQINGVDNMNYMYSLNATGNSQTTLFARLRRQNGPQHGPDSHPVARATGRRSASARGEQLWGHHQESRPPLRSCWSLYTRRTAPTTPSFWPTTPTSTSTIPSRACTGSGQTQVFGAGQYAMRLWVKPDQLAKLGITVTDIVNAIQAQNTVNPAGQVGGEPAPANQQFTYSVLAQGRLTSPEQFGNIVVREAPNGGTVRVRDVARVELGAQDYSMVSRLNGQPERDHRGLPVARLQCGPDGRRRPQADVPDEAALSGRHRLRHIARPDARRSRKA